MCFSEAASFIAAGVLTCQGAFSLNLVKNHKSYFWLAIVPFLFAIQQFSEGLIWHYFNGGLPITGIAWIAAHVFLIFAFLVWPIFIAWSLFVPERDPLRKKVLFGFVIAGVIWSIYLLLILLHLNLIVERGERNILYDVENFTGSSVILKAIYMVILIAPMFISSLRGIWIFGVLTLASAVIAEIFYKVAFTSVWCFFGALLSLVLYKIIQLNLRRI